MSNDEDETAYDQDDEELAALEQYKGSNIFARWYREVFLPNGGRIQSPDPHMLWDDLKKEFSFWLEDIESKRQAAVEKASKRTFEYWYEHVYQGDPPAEGDPKDDDQIWGAYEAWDETTHFMDDMSEDERQGWEDLCEHISLNGD